MIGTSSTIPSTAAGIESLAADIASLRPLAHSAQAAATLDTIGQRLTSLVEPDLYAVEPIAADLRNLQSAERAAVANERLALIQEIWTVLGAAAVAWLIGLALLVGPPAVGRPDAPASTVPEAATGPAPEREPAGAPDAIPIDLETAADICSAISRMTSTVQLPDLLARVAALLDASGLILWIGNGDELHPARAYGYDPRIISRLGPIARHADNATAAAWRTGELRFVAGDLVSSGAIVAPMFGPDSCVGVLAVEVRHQREADPVARAVTTMIAAQLATALAASPAAGAAPAAAGATS
jgi:hypothetical protein